VDTPKRTRLRPTWGRTLRRDPPPSGVVAAPPGFPNVRFLGDDSEDVLTRYLGDPGAIDAGDSFGVLALSGGGAGGAFGAGALTGLSEAGTRPVFHMVTGVSTGALIAPFAFLGPAWDERLKSAFTEGAPDLLALTSLRPGTSLYASAPLAALVRRYMNAELLEAVALAHAEGRRLFVATANIDAQSTSIWDMGAIATVGGEAAVQLFTDVVIASASLPGLFPPKLIAVEAGEERFEEMHVDGGAITPLFIVPEPLVLRRAQAWSGRGVEVYALMNMTLRPMSRRTPTNAVPIMVRSFELMLRSSYRGALRAVAAFCEINGFALHVGSVPMEYGHASMLRFDRETMADLFEAGRSQAAAGGLWAASGVAEPA
jgi:predicted acylesterase/phospholipase RssA